LPCGLALPRTGKPHTGTPPGAPRSTVGRHVAPLPCVCTRQRDQMSFAVCTHTAKGPDFFIFLLFFNYPCISNIAFHKYSIYNIYINIRSPNTSTTPQIHRAHIVHAYNPLHRVHIEHT
jgi:hypothetical protein